MGIARYEKAYLDRIGGSGAPLLTLEQEQALFKAIERGKQKEVSEKHRKDADKARQKIIESNLLLVASIAGKHVATTELSYMDLIQEGNIGLMQAIDKFCRSKGYRFSTYATYWIRKAVLRATSKAGQIRISADCQQDIRNLWKETARFFSEFGRQPSDQELARRLGVFEEKIHELKRAAQCFRLRQLETPLSESQDVFLEDVLSDRTAPDPEKEALFSLSLEKLTQCLNNEREVFVIRSRYGIGNGGQGKYYGEIGEEIGLTGKTVRNIERRALAKLRRSCYADFLKVLA